MKKLLLLSLILFTALVFQSCRKHSPSPGEDLVTIAFSQAATTIATTKTALVGTELLPDSETLEALVLGSTTTNDWTNIYTTSEIITKDDYTETKNYFANGKVKLNSTTDAERSFFPKVAYPLATAPTGENYIYIKALAPYEAVVERRDIIANGNIAGEGPSKVTFEIIDGQQDIMVTLPTGYAQADRPPMPSSGSGIRSSKDIDLIFVRLLSKVNFKIILETEAAATYWGSLIALKFMGGHTKFECKLEDNSITLLDLPGNKKDFPVPVPDMGIVIPAPNESSVDVGSIMVYPTTYDLSKNTDYVWTIEGSTLGLGGNGYIAFTIDINIELEKGCEHDITITFNENKKLGFNVLVTPWGEGGVDDKDIL